MSRSKFHFALFQCIKCVVAVFFGSCTILTLRMAVADEPVDYASDIRPLLSDRCYLCHGPDSQGRATELRFDEEASTHEFAVVPGEPGSSELIARIESMDDDERMPPPDSNLSLSPDEINLLRRWIAEGAKFDKHWALKPPQAVQPPEVANAKLASSAIDRFVNSRLEREGLPVQPIADRETIIRRLSFDLTGLPPTIDEIDRFLADDRPNAYQLLVDDYMSRTAFGEKWATDWLDVARYADTYGYQNDRYREMWPWRDWVVKALNENLPYDQFVTWQLAGDLLPDATREQILATAFNRNHRQTNEGGSVEEEFRAEYVADRVNTFGAAFLGLTLECCRCHDHKYDPISQADYYSLSAFFNSIDESGLYPHFNDAVPTPALALPTPDEAERAGQAEVAVGEAEDRLASLQLDGFAAWRASLEDVRPRQPNSVDSHLEAPPHDGKSAEARASVQLVELLDESLRQGLIGDYPLDGDDDNQLANLVEGGPAGKLVDEPKKVPGRFAGALELSGENGLSFPTGGDFTRDDAFTISLWLNVPQLFERAVVLHRSRAWTDAGSRGYELLIENGRLSFGLVHFWPGNAARIVAAKPLPVGSWNQVTLTYDGSSRAAGMSIFLNGQPLRVEVVRDGLTKHINGSDGKGGGEPKLLEVGNRFRDVGLKLGKIDQLRVYNRQLTELEAQLLFMRDGLPENVAEFIYNADDSLLQEYYNHRHPDRLAAEAELKRLRQERSQAVDSVPEIMVMRELPEPRQTFVLLRGAYDSPGELVSRRLPEAILPMDLPDQPTRLDLARWLTDPKHPLTSRVAVNRVWQSLFGRGLVATSEDFGLQGSPPSHPELLDWLAVDFISNGWDTKRLIKQIVMSSTYQRSSDPTPELLQRDPENELLARGPALRLSAEAMRDSALAVSGLLVPTVGGPPVKPYQPAGLWEEKSGAAYVRDKEQGSWRRSLYTYWKRTSPPPSMMTFDASNREVCVVRRQVTATPMQTLVLLNDPQFVEAARGLAMRAMEATPDLDAQLQFVFRSLTSRRASSSELEILAKMFDQQFATFAADAKATADFLSVGDLALPESEGDAARLAGLAAVAGGLMSFDETVMKR